MLAYASYVGALEAASRGYHTIVAPLLRNACLCGQAVERFHRKSSVEKNTAALSRSDPSTDRAESRTRSPSQTFPPCMSTGALVLDAVRHVTEEGSSTEGERVDNAAEVAGRAYEQGVALRIARRIREEEGGALSSEDANAIDDLLSSTERRINATGEGVAAQVAGHAYADSNVSSRTRSPSTSSTFASEGKARDEDIYNKNHKNVSSCTSFGTQAFTGGVIGNNGASREITTIRQEIVCSGSQLPSCRRHERVAWRSADPRSTKINPIAISKREFGQQTWPLARGATFLLEDGETLMGLSNAIMWAKVNPFSPLNTGCRIMPF